MSKEELELATDEAPVDFEVTAAPSNMSPIRPLTTKSAIADSRTALVNNRSFKKWAAQRLETKLFALLDKQKRADTYLALYYLGKIDYQNLVKKSTADSIDTELLNKNGKITDEQIPILLKWQALYGAKNRDDVTKLEENKIITSREAAEVRNFFPSDKSLLQRLKASSIELLKETTLALMEVAQPTRRATRKLSVGPQRG